MILTMNKYQFAYDYGNRRSNKFIPLPISLFEREMGVNRANAVSDNIGHILSHSQSLYKRDILGHYGCVNAIEFSSNGEYIASGGDDRRLLLWNIGRVIFDGKPGDIIQTPHTSNINTCSFDLHNKNIFTGGNDCQVIVYDFSRLQSSSVYRLNEAIYCFSPHPFNATNLAAACDDGKVNIIDTRLSTDAAATINTSSGSTMHSVMYNPQEPIILATANSETGIGLWDLRMSNRCTMYKASSSNSNCMSVRFNTGGDQLLALRRRSSPILYNVRTAQPMYEFDYTSYYNACTLKSCCFAGLKDEYIISGSDDFCIYMWKVPSDCSQPYKQCEPHMILKGHRSIVNQVRYCPINQMIISSGIEKLIKMWSPYNIPGSIGKLVHKRRYGDDEEVERNAYSHEEYIHMVLLSESFLSHDYSRGTQDEDPCMLAFFDSLIQRELELSAEEEEEDDVPGEPLESGDQRMGRHERKKAIRVGGSIQYRAAVSEEAMTSSDDMTRELTASNDMNRELDAAIPSNRASSPIDRQPISSSSSSSEEEEDRSFSEVQSVFNTIMRSRDQFASNIATRRISGNKISSIITAGKQKQRSRMVYKKYKERKRKLKMGVDTLMQNTDETVQNTDKSSSIQDMVTSPHDQESGSSCYKNNPLHLSKHLKSSEDKSSKLSSPSKSSLSSSLSHQSSPKQMTSSKPASIPNPSSLTQKLPCQADNHKCPPYLLSSLKHANDSDFSRIPQERELPSTSRTQFENSFSRLHSIQLDTNLKSSSTSLVESKFPCNNKQGKKSSIHFKKASFVKNRKFRSSKQATSSSSSSEDEHK